LFFFYSNNQMEDKTLVTVLISIALTCCWTAFGFGVSSVGNKKWIFTGDDGFNGLWVNCTSDDDCESIATNTNLNAVRAMVILGIIFGFIGTNLFSSMFWKKEAIKVAEAGTGFVNLGAMFWTIGMTIFTVTNSGNPLLSWGHPFGFGWANVGLLNVGGLFGWFAIKKSKDCGITECYA